MLVELILAERGVVGFCETVRRRCKKFAVTFADRLRRRRPRAGDKWQMDEVFIRIRGCGTICGAPSIEDGVVLDILVQTRRDANTEIERLAHLGERGMALQFAP
jgi:putative transposase